MKNLILVFILSRISAESVKSKVCVTRTCRRCDNYVSENKDKQSRRNTIDRTYQFCSRILSLNNCCNGVTLHLGFQRSCVKIQCKGAACSDEQQNSNVRTSNDTFTITDLKGIQSICDGDEQCRRTAGGDRGDEIGQIFSDIDKCAEQMAVESEESFITRNAQWFLVLTLGALILLGIGTFTLMKYHRAQLQKIKEYRQGYGTDKEFNN